MEIAEEMPFRKKNTFAIGDRTPEALLAHAD